MKILLYSLETVYVLSVVISFFIYPKFIPLMESMNDYVRHEADMEELFTDEELFMINTYIGQFLLIFLPGLNSIFVLIYLIVKLLLFILQHIDKAINKLDKESAELEKFNKKT